MRRTKPVSGKRNLNLNRKHNYNYNPDSEPNTNTDNSTKPRSKSSKRQKIKTASSYDDNKKPINSSGGGYSSKHRRLSNCDNEDDLHEAVISTFGENSRENKTFTRMRMLLIALGAEKCGRLEIDSEKICSSCGAFYKDACQNK